MFLYIFLIFTGFFIFLALGWHIVLGYKLVIAFLKAEDEEYKRLESKILERSILLKGVEKLTKLIVASTFLFEIERLRYALEVGYMVLFIISVTLFIVPKLSLLVWSPFFGATLFMLILWYYKFKAIREFQKLVEVE
ncbi:conserved hypothetical protein [Methanocaldococcus infernus ME]|uniref:Uncharacterized protein n=1 Tax=Methanocaldococcus infernus (strain DSM 11812 / JCM 15783 / ME) TaxID=573063 RepID=D5VS18_METIM|nr:hypothetical protein [Methanocaldococcus infernus]ADG13371.1 conserved hypothetical protein [Methanocaldococcus infernus ME]